MKQIVANINYVVLNTLLYFNASLLAGVSIPQDKMFRDRTLERPTFPVADIQTGYGLALFDSYYNGRTLSLLTLLKYPDDLKYNKTL